MKAGRKLTKGKFQSREALVAEVIRLNKDGWRQAIIGEYVQVSQSVVCSILKDASK